MFHPAVEYGTCSPTGEHRDVHCINGAVKYLPSYYLYDYILEYRKVTERKCDLSEEPLLRTRRSPAKGGDVEA